MSINDVGPPKLGRYHLLEGVSSKTFTPREIPVELLDISRKRNTIVCLGSGIGKTFIAVMLIKELAHETRLSLEDGGKRVVFLVPTCPQIYRQSKVIQDHTDLKVGKLFGVVNSQWASTFLKEIENNNVIVSTPDVFRMLLRHNIISLTCFNLVVLDECQNAEQSHLYCDIILQFERYGFAEQPRVLGLSASLISTDCSAKKLKQEIRTLGSTLKSTVETASDLTMLSKYGSKPQEFVLEYQQYTSNTKELIPLMEFLNSAIVFLDDLIEFCCLNQHVQAQCKHTSQYLIETAYILSTLGPWCTLEAISFFIREVYILLNTSNGDMPKLYITLVITVLNHVAFFCRGLLKSLHGDRVQELLHYAPPKLKELMSLLQIFRRNGSVVIRNAETNPINSSCSCRRKTIYSFEAVNNISFCPDKKPNENTSEGSVSELENTRDLCCVVFVRSCIIAYLLNLWLSELKIHCKDLAFISSNYIIGHGVDRFKKHLSLTTYKQEDVLRRFKSREYNLIVSTSFVEQSLDIPKCNLVVCFDMPENFRSYIQSKGRVKDSTSLFILMVCSNRKLSFLESLSDFKGVEQVLLENAHRSDIVDEFIQAEFVDKLMEPYCPLGEADSPKVSLSTAIALVNRYCAKLPSDTFTRLTPKWKMNEILDPALGKPLYECSVKMPINSPLKRAIVGKPMPSQHLAKMAAALETCRELHLIGELDNNLIPTGKEALKFEDQMNDSTFDKNDIASYARPGSTKRRQYYSKQISDALKYGVPRVGEPSFLYLLRMVLTCPLPDEQNTRGRKIHDPADTSRNFGILLNRAIPPICSFPVFTRSGEVTVFIEQLSNNLILDDEQLEQLCYFHKYTFSDVLRLEKYPMKFSPSESEFSFLIVPVDLCAGSCTYTIDWKFVKSIKEQKRLKPKKFSEMERESFVFVEEDYKDSVVMPWYRNLDKPQFFYVAEICFNLTPLSQFPDEVFGTFKDYYEKKYQIKIVNSTQPLLDVDHTSARLNLLTPRYVNRKGITLPTSSASTKKTKRENLQQKQILIPELCIVHPFPASLWRKAVCLPCILYRTNSLLLAEQLRSSVARGISLGMKILPPGFGWPSLDFGWTLSDVVKTQPATDENFIANTPKMLEDSVEENWNQVVESKLNRINAAENEWPSNIQPNKIVNDVMDFEIDVFDPSKCDIPDDDALIEKELESIGLSFNSPFAISSSENIWNPPESPTHTFEPIVRYGSPSNFEDNQLDCDWNAEIEGTNFFTLNASGLSYISGPGIFNMESFTLDLETHREDDSMWDSLDECSLSDDAEFEPMASNSESTRPESSISSIRKSSLELNESECLSLCSFQSHKQEEEDDDSLYDYSVKATVLSIQESKKSSIKFLKVGSYECFGNEDEVNLSPLCSLLASLESVGCCYKPKTQHKDTSLCKNDFFSNSLKHINEMKSENCSALAFGELLKNREELNKQQDGTFDFSFDECQDLTSHPGPNPSIILQAFTMSNANDGINLERLETVGDSFLKYAITAYLFCTYPDIHEGKLSFLRSKQISNLNLYRLGRRKGFGEMMVATKFEPNDNWLPPGYVVPRGLEQALIESGLPVSKWNISGVDDLTSMNEEEIRNIVLNNKNIPDVLTTILEKSIDHNAQYHPSVVPYNLLTQHSIPDKSIADCVEALIGAYLVSCGSRAATLFMSWLGLRVLPRQKNSSDDGSGEVVFGFIQSPPSPLISSVPDVSAKLERLLSGYSAFERKIGYTFKDKSYLLQAFTHASYYYNTLTDCYQRLEFLGDAVLDYLITRHLYEDPKKHSPGTLTDLRSALVNNTFFASLAVKYDFHKYFKAVSPSLFNVINKFVELKEHSSVEDYLQSYYLEEDECEEVEEVEVPKALGDIFESVAGAVYLDSNMSLDAVWKVYYAMMKPEIEYFSNHVPKSPIRELLELEPQTAKFEKAEMTLSGKVRVRVEIFGKGHFTGIGRNKRIAKCTAAKRALRELRRRRKKESLQ